MDYWECSGTRAHHYGSGINQRLTRLEFMFGYNRL